MKKFIITRLGIDFKNKNQTALHQSDNLNYTHNMVNDMLEFTYPSIANQTAKNIIWVFYYGSRLTMGQINFIKSVVQIPTIFIKDSEYRHTRKAWEHEECIVMRLDSDDFMHPTLVEKVEKKLLEKYNGNNIVISNPTKGYKFYPDFSLMNFEAPAIALAQGVISNCGAGVLHDHTRLVETYRASFPTKEIIKNNIDSDERLYLYRRHELAHSFVCDTNHERNVKLTNSLDILKEFGVLETLYWKRRNV